MKTFLLSVISFVASVGSTHAQISYVTPSGDGFQDGTSWVNTFNGNQLQAAINSAGTAQVILQMTESKIDFNFIN
ncbi:MAG: hypothetical protein ABIO46_10905 [Chitinophagales bacterium]